MKKVNGELIRAIDRDDLSGVEKCLRKGAEPNLRYRDSVPILFDAACQGQASIVACLIAAGADPRATEPKYGQNALGCMLRQRMVSVPVDEAADTVRLLLRHGLVADQRPSPDSLSPWWSALVHSHPKIVQAMIEFGTDVNKPLTAENFTPLMAAASERNTETVSLLLAAGADPSAATTAGYTALRMLEKPDEHDHDDPWSPEATAEVVALLRSSNWRG